MISSLAGYTMAILAVAFSFGIAFSYIRLSRDKELIVRHFALSQCLLSGSYLLRSFFWDIRPLLGWLTVDQSEVILVNLVFNLMALIGSYHGLRALYLMIPEKDRTQWSWLSAPMYPPWNLRNSVIGVCRTVRRLIRR